MATMAKPRKPSKSAKAPKKQPAPAAMTPARFVELYEAAGLNQTTVATLLNVNRRTVVRWVSGATPISARSAGHILAVIKPA